MRATLGFERELVQAAGRIDREHTRALADSRAEDDRLATDVATGERRLYVRASCPSTGMPEATATAGMDDGAAAELDTAARQDYFALRSQLRLTERALDGLQDYVSEVCQ